MMTSVAGQHHLNELNNNQSSNMRVTGTNRAHWDSPQCRSASGAKRKAEVLSRLHDSPKSF